MKGIKDAIEFKNVTFAYVPGKNVLNGINLRIPAGRRWLSSVRAEAARPPSAP